MVPLGVAAALLAVAAASEACATELFEPPAGRQEQRPLFGTRVDGLFQDVRTRVFEPTWIAAAQMLKNPSARAVIDQASVAIRQFAEKVNTDLVHPAADAMENLLLRPEVGHSFTVAEESARHLQIALRRWVAEPWSRAAEALVTPEDGGSPLGAKGALRPAAPIIVAARPGVPSGVGDVEDNDPLEPINRVMFGFNRGLQMTVMEPLSHLYSRSTTPPVRRGMRNFFANLREPVTVASDLLEGRMEGAGNATARFGIITVLGVAGVLDPVTQMGFPAAPHNLEQTLCGFGFAPGPYIVLPILGPATARDAVGRIVTVVAYFEVMGATIYIPYRATDIILQYVDRRERMELMNSISVDPYVAQKALYLATKTLTCDSEAAAAQEFSTR